MTIMFFGTVHNSFFPYTKGRWGRGAYSGTLMSLTQECRYERNLVVYARGKLQKLKIEFEDFHSA